MDGYLQASLRVLHILGMAAWIGGIVVAALIVALVAEDVRKGAATAARRAALYVAAPGMAVAWIAGLGILIPNFGSMYARAGWMHGKLTAALVATALTGVLSGALRRAAKGEEVKPAVIRGMALGILALAAIVIVAAKFQPGGAG